MTDEEALKIIGAWADVKYEPTRNAAQIAASALRERIERPGWISVKDRLPEVPAFEHADDDWVMDRGYKFLVAYSDGVVEVENFWTKTGFPDSVTHWMPLPEPPEVSKCQTT